MAKGISIDRDSQAAVYYVRPDAQRRRPHRAGDHRARAERAGDDLLIVSGAFGLFDKRTAVLAGGHAHDTVGADMELVVRMHGRLREEGVPYGVRFVPDPVCWTEAPESLCVLRRQCNRWHRGLIDTL